ncbi:MAG: hypothetical protein R3A48_07655 [Polyangiales bacterium]
MPPRPAPEPVSAPAVGDALEPVADAAPATPSTAQTAAPTATPPALELPAAPKELRPSPLVTTSTRVPYESLEKVAPRDHDPVSEATAEAIAHVRREGAWRTVLRVVGVVTALALCMRLAFDDAMPRLVLALGVGAFTVVLVARVTQAWSAARRRRVMLDSLDLLVRAGNASPEALRLLAPQIASLVDALRAHDAPTSSISPDEVVLRALGQAGNKTDGASRSD